MYKYHITNIKWDTDGEEADLPTELNVSSSNPMDEDEISDHLSDEYGFCHNGFDCERIA